MGSFINRIDAKGRVSVPASFRGVLKTGTEGAYALILRPSHRHPCIEGWSHPGFAAMAARASDDDPFSEDAEDRALTLFASSVEPPLDREGRLVLPADLAAAAGISDQMMFIGLGALFQIWEPQAGQARIAAARARRVASERTPGPSA